MALKIKQLPFMAVCCIVIHVCQNQEVVDSRSNNEKDDDHLKQSQEGQPHFVYSDWSFWDGVKDESDLLEKSDMDTNLNSVVAEILRSRRQSKTEGEKDSNSETGGNKEKKPSEETEKKKVYKPGEKPWNIQSGKNDDAMETMLVRNLRWKNECAQKLGVTLSHSRLKHFEEYFTSCMYKKFRQESFIERKGLHYTSIIIATILKLIANRY